MEKPGQDEPNGEFLQNRHSPPGELQARLAEYSALRDEILKRIDTRQQIISYTITIAAAFLTFAVGTDVFNSPFPLLIYPILATFLAMAWSHSDQRAGEIGEYIREEIEPNLPGMGWEKWIRQRFTPNENTDSNIEGNGQKRAAGYNKIERLGIWLKKFTVEIYAYGIFVSTQIIAILFAFGMWVSDEYVQWFILPVERIFLLSGLIIAILSTIFTLFLITIRRREYRKKVTKNHN